MWVSDAPTGTYKNFALSSKIREKAVANSQFMMFADTEPGFGKNKGGALTITRVHDLPLATAVDEQSELPSGRPLIDTISATPVEWGYKVKLTEFEENLTHFDLRNKVQRALKNQLRLSMDKMAADAFKLTPIKACSSSATAVTFDTDGTMSSDPTNNMTVAHLGAMRDYLVGDLKAPPYEDGSYIMIASTKALRGLKNDTTYSTWFAPQNSQALVTGEIKGMEGIRIIESNHFNALDNSINAGVTGEAILFGADAIFLASVAEPELRRGVSQDLGRFTEVGWVGTLQAGLVWTSAATARVIHWTAATL